MSILCPMKPWGMGTTIHDDGETGYGFTETSDPTKFHPDIEMCTPEEIANHNEALEYWKKSKTSEDKVFTPGRSLKDVRR